MRLVAAQRTIHLIEPDVQDLLPDYETACTKFPPPPPSYSQATQHHPPPSAAPAHHSPQQQQQQQPQAWIYFWFISSLIYFIPIFHINQHTIPLTFSLKEDYMRTLFFFKTNYLVFFKINWVVCVTSSKVVVFIFYINK